MIKWCPRFRRKYFDNTLKYFNSSIDNVSLPGICKMTSWNTKKCFQCAKMDIYIARRKIKNIYIDLTSYTQDKNTVQEWTSKETYSKIMFTANLRLITGSPCKCVTACQDATWLVCLYEVLTVPLWYFVDAMEAEIFTTYYLIIYYFIPHGRIWNGIIITPGITPCPTSKSFIPGLNNNVFTFFYGKAHKENEGKC